MDHQKQYVQAMKGFYNMCALWSPEQPFSFKPGVCGYFDAQGDWNSIVDPTQPDQVDSTLTRPPSLPRSKKKSIGRWGPICSDNVKWAQTELQTPIEVPQVGVTFEFKLEFMKEKGYGATLITGPSVTETYLENPKTLFHEWAKTNYRSISDKYCDVRENGLWIITKVFQTPRCAILSMSGDTESACIYLGGTAMAGGSLTLGGALGEEKQSGIWRFFPPDVRGRRSDSTPYTVFVGGLRYCETIFGAKEVPITAPMRGEDEIFEKFSIDRDNTQLDVVCEDWDSLSEALRGD